jgi:Protein of unknown function (DUF1761)
MELKINMITVLVAVVINFVVGALWYMPLFGKAWAKEHGFDLSNKPPSSTMMKGMAFMVIGNFFFAWVFAHNIAAWSFVPGMSEMSMTSNSISAAVFTWLGFYFPGLLGATVWENKSWKLFFIDGCYNLVALLITAFLLNAWPAN